MRGDFFRLAFRRPIARAAAREIFLQTRVAQSDIKRQSLFVAGLRGGAVPLARVQSRQQQVRGRKAGMLGDERLD